MCERCWQNCSVPTMLCVSGKTARLQKEYRDLKE
jgi:hypothetical protein